MEPTELNRQPDRTVYFDYLRVFATLAVMILHISAQNWAVTDVNGHAWRVFNFADSVVRWGVPVFVMISGSLFLGRDIPVQKLYTKYVLRMAISFVVWAAVYALFIDGTLLNRLSAVVEGHYHMWFILMITGLYMCLPLIKPITETDSRLKYYLLLAFVFAFLLPELATLLRDFGNETVVNAANAIGGDLDDMDMHVVLGYAGYFILGFYLNKTELTRRQRLVVYALGVLGFAFTVMMDLIVALRTQTCCSHYYSNFTVNVLLEAVAVFTWFKYRRYDRERLNAFMRKMAKYSFGAYLVHALVIEQLDARLGLNTLAFEPVLAVVGIGVIVFVVSFAVSALLNQIPIVKKYMV